MSSVETQLLTLLPHPSTPSAAVRGVGARVVRAPDGVLALTYAVAGDLDKIRLPEPRPARRVDGLWQHTCLEAFVAPDTGPAYLELNFSPSGEWASYAFSAYRTGMAVAENIEAPRIAVARHERRLTVDVTIDLTCLPGDTGARIALAAVVEESNGSRTYWALEHPPGKPDFHHRCGFALRI